MLYVGLDVHYRTSTLSIVDSNGREVKNQTLRGPVSRTVDLLRSLAAQDQLSICYEASVGYGTLFDELSSFAANIRVAHPGALRLIFKSKRKNDRIDASRLAKLLYLGEVPQVHVPSGQVRAWRELIETRRRTIDKRTMAKNALKAILRGRHVDPPFKGKSLWTKKGRQWLEELELDDTARMRRTLLLAELDQLEMHVKTLTRELDRIAIQHAGVKLLMTIPGVGPRTAECLIAYIDDIRRFAHTGQVSSYFGLIPCQDASAGVNRLGHITKNGPATARKMLIEAAWQAKRLSPTLRSYFERICAGKKDRRKIALVALAHKLVRVVSGMLRSGEAWRESPAMPDQPPEPAATTAATTN
jgi:transposase